MISAFDCLIVGGGPAGLAAATYLARYRRPVTILDDGRSRARWIPSTKNYPGFPDGVSGATLLSRMRDQAERYGVVIHDATVEGVEKIGDGFLVRAGAEIHRARTVLIATGVSDGLPAVPGWSEDAIVSGSVRLCPVCDGFEVSGRAVGVWGGSRKAAKEALFLRTYTADLTVLCADPMPEEDRIALAEAGISIEVRPVARFAEAGTGVRLAFGDSEERRFDALYLAMGAPPRSELATALGANVNDAGCLFVDAYQRTSVPGLYSAGDVVDELNQISVAVGHAAIAATAIHNRLPKIWSR